MINNRIVVFNVKEAAELKTDDFIKWINQTSAENLLKTFVYLCDNFDPLQEHNNYKILYNHIINKLKEGDAAQ